ncbi:YncE family protein [Acidisphaera sp. L21]|jgi:DNA-binding beta-propeller fold protein YncE|uniref:lactonase family protein n=1 Tax=Acidisphaera sp. L21 TaxID=1641851 RepID=UPI00131E893E|nr:YncE family protein [Acidisphaera sp. L21]
MNYKYGLPALYAAGVLLACGTAAKAGPNDLLIGLDSKVGYDANGQQNIQPGADAVLVLDITNAARPRIRTSLPLVNSLLGPPTNLQITPNGRLGLVANSVGSAKEGDVWKSPPDDKLYVIDLAANPPKLIDTVTVGKQPSGLVISRKGDLVLIANRAGKSVSVVTIDGTTVKAVAEIPMPNEVAAVTMTPDGKRAFAVMNTANRVGVLAIDGQKVTYDKSLDMPVGFNPYNIDITPDGKFAVASSTGAGLGNADALTVIDTAGAHPHISGLTTAGNGAEGFAISPNGKWAVVPLLLGSGGKYADWNYTKKGEAVLLSVGAGGQLTVVNRLPLGGLPEGVAFSPQSDYVYIGNYIDKNLQIFRIAGGRLVATGTVMPLPGQPASIRGLAR